MMQDEKFGNAGIISQDEKAYKFLGIWDSGVHKKKCICALIVTFTEHPEMLPWRTELEQIHLLFPSIVSRWGFQHISIFSGQ